MQPVIHTAPTGGWPKGGGVYLECTLVRNVLQSTTSPALTVWRDYVRANASAPSVPGIRTDGTMRLVVRITAGSTNESGNTLTGAKVLMRYGWTTSPPAGTFITNRDPGPDGGGLPVIRRVTVANPAAGADWSQSVPAFCHWRVEDIRADLATDATVGNRTVRFHADDSSGSLVAPVNFANQAASTSQTYAAARHAKVAASSALGSTIIAGCPDHVMPAAWRVRSATPGLQPGDQWSSINILAAEWAVPG